MPNILPVLMDAAHVAINFDLPYSPTAPGASVVLNFGGASTVVPTGPPRVLSVHATASTPVLHAHTVFTPTARVAAVVAAPVLHADTVYESNTSRPLTHTSADAWRMATPQSDALLTGWQYSDPLLTDHAQAWQRATFSAAVAHVLFAMLLSDQKSCNQPFALAIQALGAINSVVFKQLSPAPFVRATHWQQGVPLDTTKQDRFVQLVPLSCTNAQRWQGTQHLSMRRGLRFGKAQPHMQATRIPWALARRPLWGVTPPYVAPVTPPYQPSTVLNFECFCISPSPLAVLLNFGNHPCQERNQAALHISAARFYMTAHHLIAHRLPDGAEIPLFDATLSADAGSFAWSFTASGPDSLFTQLAPTLGATAAVPQQLQITLDGMTWVFAVESLKRDHSFGKKRIAIAGRSVTALIGAPWLREVAWNNDAAATAQQLAASALDLSGVAMDWRLTDWLVPASAWSIAGTPLTAVQHVVESVGGYLQSHRSAPTLIAAHPYPKMPDGSYGGPWNWGIGAADVELAPDAIITNSMERRDGADVDAVYVSGTTQGVLGFVKRAGTAGAKLAQPLTHELITHADAAQQLGLSVLGRAGPQFAIQMELPILTGPNQPGVIDVGSLVQINESAPWRGRVRSVSVNATMPKARQTITLERHL